MVRKSQENLREALGLGFDFEFADGTRMTIYPATLEDLGPALEAWYAWQTGGGTIQAAYLRRGANANGEIQAAFEELLHIMFGRKIAKEDLRKRIRVDNGRLAKAISTFLGLNPTEAEENGEGRTGLGEAVRTPDEAPTA